MDTRPPRGALAVVAVGLIATALAAWLSTDEAGGSSVQLEWIARASLPDSAPADIPGGGSMRLERGALRATETNGSGEKIFRASALLRIEADSAVGQARVRCRVSSGDDFEVGRSFDTRGVYPRSSGDYNLLKQEVPGDVAIKLHIKGAEYASLPHDDLGFDAYTDLPGLTASWAPYHRDSHEWQWGLPEGRPERPVELGFASYWRGTGAPQAKIACKLETANGSATARTAGRFGRRAGS